MFDIIFSVIACSAAFQDHDANVWISASLWSILSTIAARHHSIFGHIRRLPDSTPADKALKLVMNSRSGDAPHDDWNRPAGTPRTSWMSQIMRDTGLTAADTDDRSTWRALRPTAGYAQHWLTVEYIQFGYS